jgi:hypothetical protein
MPGIRNTLGRFNTAPIAVASWRLVTGFGAAAMAAIRATNELRLSVVIFFGLLTTHPVANLKHYAFMVEG